MYIYIYIYIYIQMFAFWSGGFARGFRANPGFVLTWPREHSKIPVFTVPGPHGALASAARACFGAAERSQVLLERASELQRARKCCSSACFRAAERSQLLLEKTVQKDVSGKLCLVTLNSGSLHSALLNSVHGYARVHTSIYIYIYNM